MLSGRKEKKMRRMIREFWENEDGMGVVEVVLITIEIFIFNISVYNVSIV